MARAVWSGSLSFGLVNVPVKAFSAVHDHDVHFHQLDPKGDRISYEKRSSKTGQKVDKDEIVLGYELSPGHYVQLDPDELAELRPGSTRTLEVNDFVDLSEIDPVYYQNTYWLAPADEPAAAAYKLLASAMEDKSRVGIGTVVMRNKQYLAAVRPVRGLLAMSTMRFADEVVAGEDVDGMPVGKAPDAKHIKLANQIIDALATDWDPTRYHDTYTEELKSLIEAKAKGKKIVVEEEAPAEANVVDLMQALEASLAAARKGGGRKLASEVAKVAEELADKADAEDGKDDSPEPAKKQSGTAKRKPSSKGPTKKRSSSRAKAARKSA
jgi:DNA end-binding protein Ku